MISSLVVMAAAAFLQQPPAATVALPEQSRGHLLVVDYAERWPVDELSQPPAPIRREARRRRDARLVGGRADARDAEAELVRVRRPAQRLAQVLSR